MDQQPIYSCTFYDHHYEQITGFCLNESCKEKQRKCCTRCQRDKHLDHRDDCKTFKEIMIQFKSFKEQITLWNDKTSSSFKIIQNLQSKNSLDAIKFLKGEKNNLIEFGNKLQEGTYQFSKEDILKLKNRNEIMSSYTCSLEGQYLIEFYITKIECYTKAFLKNDELKRIPYLNIQLAQIKNLKKINLRNDFPIIDKTLIDLMQIDQKKVDIRLIQFIIQSQHEIVCQWNKKVDSAFDIFKQIKEEWENFLRAQMGKLTDLLDYLKQENYKEFFQQIQNLNYRRIHFLVKHLKIDFFSATSENIFMAFLKLQKSFEKRTIYIQNNNQIQFDNLQQFNIPKHESQIIEQRAPSSIIVNGVFNSQKCKKRGHENEVIVGFCIFKDCKDNEECCLQCFNNDHDNHKAYHLSLFQTKIQIQNQFPHIIQQFKAAEESLRAIQYVQISIKIVQILVSCTKFIKFFSFFFV